MNTIPTYTKILKDTTRILKHQKEIAILKGETFNLFSILKMESRENDTHSAFLGELLNPKGSHHFGSIFLELFLKQIGNETIDPASSTVVLEYPIGTNDHINKTGGRVDIYIKDAAENTICIENKIYAPDQYVQIERYVNHNVIKNTVFYLTLDGKIPSKESRGDLIEGEDYFCISYHNTIIDWLEACSKEATDKPIIRESIKQYIILLKKLTSQLSDSKMEKEIKDLIITNYTAARTISSNLETVELDYSAIFLAELQQQLEKTLKKDGKIWAIEVSEDLNQSWTGVYISNKNWPTEIQIKLEGASKIPWTNSIFGVKVQKTEFDRLKIKQALGKVELLQQDFKESLHWAYYKTILNLGDVKERAKLFKEGTRKELVNTLSSSIIQLCLVCEEPLSSLK
jgi:hypothetical protein